VGKSAHKSYLRLNEHEVLHLLLLIVDGYLDVLAVEVAEGAGHSETAKHSPEDDVAPLLLDALLLICARGFVIVGEVEGFAIAAEDCAGITHIGAH
jgi:hypothetical protein